MRAIISVLILLSVFSCAAQAAEDNHPIPPMVCTCDANSAVGPCPSFHIRFIDKNSAQISRSGHSGSWSSNLPLTTTRETFSIAGDVFGDPKIGCLTIERVTGRFRSEIIEYGYQEFTGWVNSGLCKAIPAQ